MNKIKTIFSAAANKIKDLAESTYELVQKKTQTTGGTQTPSTSQHKSNHGTLVKRDAGPCQRKRAQKAAVIAGLLFAGSVYAQTVYDSTTLVDTNNTSNSTSTVTTTNTSTSTSTNNSTSAVTSTNTNTNNNFNVNSGTQTLNNNNVNTGTMTYNNNNVNTGTMTYNNNNTNTSTSVNTNNNVNSGTMTYNNNNVSSMTSNNVNQNINSGTMTNNNNNVNSSTSTNTNNNLNTSTSNNVNQNVQTGDMTNRNINDTTITQKVIQPPPTAIAPAMMSGGNTDLCTTGTSSAVQTQIFGVSSGGTVRDENCERLKLSKTLYDMGMKVAAVATMCQDKRVFDAMMAAGTPCPAEGKIGEAAKTYWAENPDKIPQPVKEKEDDTYKKVGLGSLLGIFIHNLFK